MAQVWFNLILGQRKNLTQQQGQQNCCISPALSTAKLRKKRKRKEGCSEMGQGELVHMESTSHISKLLWGMCCGICPQFHQTVRIHVNLPVHVLDLPGTGLSLSLCTPCVCREGNTLLLSHAACRIHPSIPAFPCLSLCYGACTAISSSDF